MNAVIERRPEGPLNAVVDKIEYFTHDGVRRLYLVVSFMVVDGVERPIEFFMPVGQTGEPAVDHGHHAQPEPGARGFLDKALADLRKVAWDRGPVRYGYKTRDDGARIPCGMTVRSRCWPMPSRASLPTGATAARAQHQRLAGGSARKPVRHQVARVRGQKCPDCGARHDPGTDAISAPPAAMWAPAGKRRNLALPLRT